MARQPDDRIPEEVEPLLVDAVGSAGALGGEMATPMTGSPARMGRAGRRGGERGARLLRTQLAERSGAGVGSASGAGGRVAAAFAGTRTLPAGRDTTRLVIPWGIGALQRVVVDLDDLDPPGTVRLRAYAKGGLLGRGLAERAWTAVTAD